MWPQPTIYCTVLRTVLFVCYFSSKTLQKNYFSIIRFIGHSLTPDEMVSLHDVYQELDPNQRKMRASYVFQFLWRDLSSEFDVIGPYFKSEAGMKHQFVMTCILNTIHALHLYGFEVMALVLDGASTNLAAIKYFSMGMTFHTVTHNKGWLMVFREINISQNLFGTSIIIIETCTRTECSKCQMQRIKAGYFDRFEIRLDSSNLRVM